ncbi:MAG: DUF2523 domain-containing protein [Gammaproteobacteria bacterium]|nr:DUF2523 domain-containing protein [Gammaproteobacteria bacterium]
MKLLLTFISGILLPLMPGIMKGLASYVAVSIGFSLVAFTGLSFAFDKLRDYMQANMDGLDTKVAQLLAMAGADVFINVVLTCLVFAYTLNGMMAANGYRPSWRKPIDPS